MIGLRNPGNNKTRRNISKEEYDSLKYLKDKSNLFITAADKGGASVILDYDFYKCRIMDEHLSDNPTYQFVHMVTT